MFERPWLSKFEDYKNVEEPFQLFETLEILKRRKRAVKQHKNVLRTHIYIYT